MCFCDLKTNPQKSQIEFSAELYHNAYRDGLIYVLFWFTFWKWEDLEPPSELWNIRRNRNYF